MPRVYRFMRERSDLIILRRLLYLSHSVCRIRFSELSRVMGLFLCKSEDGNSSGIRFKNLFIANSTFSMSSLKFEMSVISSVRICSIKLVDC